MANLETFDDPMALLQAERALSRQIYETEERIADMDLDTPRKQYRYEAALAFVAGGKPNPAPYDPAKRPSVPEELTEALAGIRQRRLDLFEELKQDAVAEAQKAITEAQKALNDHKAKLQPHLDALAKLDGCPFMSAYDAAMEEAYALIRSGIGVSRTLDLDYPVTNRLVDAVEAAESAIRAAEAKPFPDAGGFSGEIHAAALDGVEQAWRARFAERPDLFGPTLLDALNWQRDALIKIRPIMDRAAKDPHAAQPGWRFEITYAGGKITGGNLSKYDRRPTPEPTVMAA